MSSPVGPAVPATERHTAPPAVNAAQSHLRLPSAIRRTLDHQPTWDRLRVRTTTRADNQQGQVALHTGREEDVTGLLGLTQPTPTSQWARLLDPCWPASHLRHQQESLLPRLPVKGTSRKTHFLATALTCPKHTFIFSLRGATHSRTREPVAKNTPTYTGGLRNMVTVSRGCVLVGSWCVLVVDWWWSWLHDWAFPVVLTAFRANSWVFRVFFWVWSLAVLCVCPFVVNGSRFGRLDQVLEQSCCALSAAYISFCTCHGSAGWPLERPEQMLVVLGWTERSRLTLFFFGSLPSNN